MQVLIQISAGRGPAECQRAVAHMLRRVGDETKRRGWSCDLVEAEPGPREKDCLLSALIEIEADAQDGVALKTWATSLCGSHLWICRSPFRPLHGRKNWFFGVSLLPAVDEIRLRPEEIRFEAFRASGPGGQHVNKTSSAVRVIWISGGLSTVASGERSQAQNRRIALARLQSLVDQKNEARQVDAQKTAWQKHNGLERGKAVLTFVGAEFELK